MQVHDQIHTAKAAEEEAAAEAAAAAAFPAAAANASGSLRPRRNIFVFLGLHPAITFVYSRHETIHVRIHPLPGSSDNFDLSLF